VAELSDTRESVRERYAAAAKAAREGADGCCDAPSTYRPADATGVFGRALYGTTATDGAPEPAMVASLGCGVPTAVAELREGETVLDLGSGGGADVLISAKRVGATGRAIGLDMTDEMLELARANATAAGVENIDFLKGYLEDIPLPDASVDVVISNCVINLAADKPKVIREAARVLRPGGRFAVSDVITKPGFDERSKADVAAWTGCIAGAITDEDFRLALSDAGFENIEITPTHAVHELASAAIIRANKPLTFGCCSATTLAGCCEPAAKADCCGAATTHPPSSCGCD
jgi:ubiquinone/menaquinone biosynthesis C-methylase UbiE